MIKEALKFAKEKHSGQKRIFSNEPYVNHPVRVMEIIDKNKKTNRQEDLFVAAVLHDILEETKTTENEIKELFGERVLELVKELTTNENEKEELGKTKYLIEKMSDPKKMSNWGLIIKLADRLDNISDQDKQTPEFKERYNKQTQIMIEELNKRRELSPTQTILVNKIKEVLK